MQKTFSQIPSINVQTLNGESYNTGNFTNKGKPFIIFFWGSYCKTSRAAFDNISEVYADWQSETGVKIIAVAIDDSKTQSKVSPMISSEGWEFEFYMDTNQDFKRAMSVANCPHIFLMDGTGKIAFQQTGYLDGQEVDIYDKVLKLSQGKTLD